MGEIKILNKVYNSYPSQITLINPQQLDTAKEILAKYGIYMHTESVKDYNYKSFIEGTLKLHDDICKPDIPVLPLYRTLSYEELDNLVLKIRIETFRTEARLKNDLARNTVEIMKKHFGISLDEQSDLEGHLEDSL